MGIFDYAQRCYVDELTVIDDQSVIASRQSGGELCFRSIEASVQLAKGGQRRRRHPHDEIRVFEAGPIVLIDQLAYRLLPTRRLRRALEDSQNQRI